MHGVLRKTFLFSLLLLKTVFVSSGCSESAALLGKRGERENKQGGRGANKGLERLLLAREQGLVGISGRSWSR